MADQTHIPSKEQRKAFLANGIIRDLPCNERRGRRCRVWPRGSWRRTGRTAPTALPAPRAVRVALDGFDVGQVMIDLQKGGEFRSRAKSQRPGAHSARSTAIQRSGKPSSLRTRPVPSTCRPLNRRMTEPGAAHGAEIQTTPLQNFDKGSAVG